MLTWATFCLLKAPHELAAAQQEVDAVLGGRPVAYDDIMKLEQVLNDSRCVCFVCALCVSAVSCVLGCARMMVMCFDLHVPRCCSGV